MDPNAQSAPESGGRPPSQHQPPQQSAPSVPQLPPQMFTTAASLLDLTDKKLVVTLRDGRKLLGVLRSWDQFGNLVLQDATERIFSAGGGAAPFVYADIPRGMYLVRGENVLLMGEVDLDRDDYIPPPYTEAPATEVWERVKQETKARKGKDAMKLRKLKDMGFEGEHAGEVLL